MPDADEDVIITLKKDKNGDFKIEYAGIRNQGKSSTRAKLA